MTRPVKVDDRRPKTLSLDSTYYKEFERIVGAGNVSEEIRAFIKERVEQEKGANTGVTKNDMAKPRYIFQDFEVRDKRDELAKYVNLETDMKKLNILFKNCMAAASMINRRKLENSAKANFDRRAAHKSNDEIIRDIKEERRRTRV